MREVADAERIHRFIRALGGETPSEVRVYFTGGATAVLLGWRRSTIDVDLKIAPEDERLLVPQGWEDRSLFIAREGQASCYHFDPYAQALAKIERSHTQDVEDVRAMLRLGLIDRPGQDVCIDGQREGGRAMLRRSCTTLTPTPRWMR